MPTPTDVSAESSPAVPTEDIFYTGVTSDSPADTSATSDKGTVQTEAATEPAGTDGDPNPKSEKSNWATMRAARYRAEAERDELRRRLDEREAQRAEPAKEPQRQAASLPAASAEPKLEDFLANPEGKFKDFSEANAAFLATHSKWVRDGVIAEQMAEKQRTDAAAAERTRQEQSAKHLDRWNARETEVLAKHSDYDEMFAAFMSTAKANPALATAVFESEVGPDLARHFGADPDDLKRVSGLDSKAMLKAIGILEDRIQSDKGSTSEKHITKAPRPSSSVKAPVGGGAKELSTEEVFYGKN